MNFNKQDKLDIFENAITWVVVLAMLIYGLGKIVQFEEAVDVNQTIEEMTGMELMWAFYSYSKPFVYILGVFEVIGGILLLIRKTRLIGCLFSSTILVNIIIQDIFFEVHLGALKAAILYQLLMLIILWLNKDILIKSIKHLLKTAKTKQTKTKSFVKLLIAFVMFLILRILEYYITIK